MPTQSQSKRRAPSQTTDKPAKRTRVSRACDQCRTAREKCDGLQPACSTCSNSKRNCAYTASVKKRGIQPGYIRTLELALACLFQHNAENETILNEQLAQGGISSLLLSRNSKESNRLHKRWRKTKFCVDVDRLLSGGDSSRHEPSELLSPETDEEDSDQDDLFATKASYDQLPEENLLPATRITQASQQRQQRQQQLSVSSQHFEHTALMVSLPPDSWRLFETYFTFTQCWLPICEKHDMLRLSYSYPAQGLSITTNQEGSGAHAELWSILAVASLNQSSTETVSELSQSSQTPDQLYKTARSLVPIEQGEFDLGHVRALLNMAIFNMIQALPEVAWLLVGCACRILDVMSHSKFMGSPRRKHIFSGCFLLDSMLALQLERHPYFRRTDFEYLGMIDEDGLEEWQPWNGHAHPSLLEQPKAPILALSTFKYLLDIVDIMVDREEQRSSSTYNQHIAIRLESWSASLPSKLDYIRSDTGIIPSTPPALLLRMTYCCAEYMLTPSEQWVKRGLDALQQYDERMDLERLPPLIHCLLSLISRHSIKSTLSEATRDRLQILQNNLNSASPRVWLQNQPNKAQTGKTSHTRKASRLPTPDSLQIPLPRPMTTNLSRRIEDARSTTNPLEPLLEVPVPRMLLDLPYDPLNIAPGPAKIDGQYTEVTDALDTFFDELATLDNSTTLDNQPQFMQNLGFAPDLSMADLFSEYIPMQSTAFLGQEDPVTVNFDQYSFYGTS